MLGRTDSRRRLLVLLIVFAIGSLALLARTAYWQVLRGDFLLARAAAQTTVRIEVAGRRGDVYDRTGTVLLATTIDRDRLVAAADQLARDPDARRRTGDELVRLLKLDDEDARTLRERLDSGRPYIVIARGIEPSVSERIRQALREKRIVNVGLEAEPERVYPQAGGGPETTLAAHLLGFVNRENVGQYGVEQAYQDALQDQELGANGPTAFGNNEAIAAARYAQQQQMERMRQAGRLRMEGVRQGNRREIREQPTYRDLNPPMRAPKRGAAAPRIGDIPTVRSVEEARELPRGTTFRTPDGKIKVR